MDLLQRALLLLCFLTTPVFAALYDVTEHPAWSPLYAEPSPSANASEEVQACYSTLGSCMLNCDNRFPSTPYEANKDFGGCVRICNKDANRCLIKAKNDPCNNVLASCIEDCDSRFPATLYETNPNFPSCANICSTQADECSLLIQKQPLQPAPAIVVTPAPGASSAIIVAPGSALPSTQGVPPP